MAKVIGIGHISFTVMEMQRTLDFYCGLLGGTVLAETIDEGPELALRVMGDRAEDNFGKLKVAMVELGGMQIEFLQYLTPKTKVSYHGDPSRAGSAHIAVKVDDIEEMYQRLKSAGVIFHSEVNDCIRDGTLVWKWVYARDPDNVCCELVQVMD
ncbi:MAG: VOC family protein [Clostridiaceae bacterium]|jgi:glyoxylase I family protein|nr:VOC family protein [Clostridiaceae bacterium]